MRAIAQAAGNVGFAPSAAPNQSPSGHRAGRAHRIVPVLGGTGGRDVRPQSDKRKRGVVRRQHERRIGLAARSFVMALRDAEGVSKRVTIGPNGSHSDHNAAARIPPYVARGCLDGVFSAREETFMRTRLDLDVKTMAGHALDATCLGTAISAKPSRQNPTPLSAVAAIPVQATPRRLLGGPQESGAKDGMEVALGFQPLSRQERNVGANTKG